MKYNNCVICHAPISSNSIYCDECHRELQIETQREAITIDMVLITLDDFPVWFRDENNEKWLLAKHDSLDGVFDVIRTYSRKNKKYRLNIIPYKEDE